MFDKFHVAQASGRSGRSGAPEGEQSNCGPQAMTGWWERAMTGCDNPRPDGRPAVTGETLPPYASSELKTARAWALKETSHDALDTYQYKKAQRGSTLTGGIAWAAHSRLGPMKEVAENAEVAASTRVHHLPQASASPMRPAKVDQREDPMGQVHGPRLPQFAELHPRDLLPLRRVSTYPRRPGKSKHGGFRKTR